MTAVESLSLTVSNGTICALIGPNGSGKSTLFRAIIGSITPVGGSIWIAGGSIHDAIKDRLVAYLPQSEAIDPDAPLSVRDLVEMGRYGATGLRRRLSPADHALVDDALHRVRLEAVAVRQIGQLSGGQRKRAFVARALAQSARILLLDEPFAGVDIATQETLLGLLSALRSQGATILIATHDLRSISHLCDQIVTLGTASIVEHVAA